MPLPVEKYTAINIKKLIKIIANASNQFEKNSLTNIM